MAGSNQNCWRRPCPRQYPAPAPLYARVSDLDVSEPRRPAARESARVLSEPEMRIHPSPASRPAVLRDPEISALLRQQNQLLLDILGALNAQLAAGLRTRGD